MIDDNVSTIKKANTPDEIVTKEEYDRRIREIAKCKKDIVYFANTYFKILNLNTGITTIKLYPKQEEMLRFFKDEKRAICLSARQSGKSSMYTIYLLWLCSFFPEKKAMLLANKAATAIELLGRIQLGYEYLPDWLKPRVSVWNKGHIAFANKSEIRCFASSSDAARGFSCNCVTGDTMVTVLTDNEEIYYIKIANLSNVNKNELIDEFNMSNYKYHFVYKTVNLINGREYTGVHSTNKLNDGYLGSGKILKQAVEKYGPENFERTIIEFFDNRADAFKKEKELVNEEYRCREDTYNINLGGDVAPCLPGELNGFYGKHHTEEVKKIMRERKKEYYKSHNSPLVGHNFYEDDDVIVDGIRYTSFSDALCNLKIGNHALMEVLLKPGNGYVDEKRQDQLKKDYDVYLKEKEIRHQHHLEAIRIAAKNPEKRKKISNALKGKKHWWQDKVNKNPEKIRKMAEKHRGMKRSEEARKRMSEARKKYFANGGKSNNKGKIAIINLSTREIKYIEKMENIPDGWKRGIKI